MNHSPEHISFSFIFLLFLAYRFLSLSFLNFSTFLLPPPFTKRTQTAACHPFRRFCPPPRRTINFLDLNPGLCATTTTTTTTTIDRFRFHGAYRTPSVEMRLVPASCALVYRSDDIFTRVPRSNLDIRFNSLRHPQREPSHVYLASSPRKLSDTFTTSFSRVIPLTRLSSFLPFISLSLALFHPRFVRVTSRVGISELRAHDTP